MSSLPADTSIAQYFNRVLSKYELIRGKNKSELGAPFWDVVILTTADEDQKRVYEAQIRYKYDRSELPLGVPVLVVADPPGPKLGNGGSTFTAVQLLHDEYGEDLYNKRVLLIHAGGQSQRMPSASILGKIFSPVPRGWPLYQMLDLKLAMFLPLVSQMCPGVFVTCADDFLVYNLSNADQYQFSSEGFTALAHPSTVAVGTVHGVYVIKDIDKVDPNVQIQQCECLEVLQKPTESLMYKKGAVLNRENVSFANGIKVSGRVAYTDSSFFFSHDVTRKFLQFNKEHGSVTCEIDAYGDFLQALGKQASPEYINNTSNVSTITPDLLATRRAVFNMLKGTELSLLVMNSSKFIHIGTTKEYISSFCCDDVFQDEMGLSKDVFNLWTGNDESLSDCSSPKTKRKKTGTENLSDTALGCVMHSVLPKDSNISSRSVVEYCSFSVPVNVGQGCIVSNCEYDPKVKVEERSEGASGDNVHEPAEGKSKGTSGDNVHEAASIDFPHDIFIHTIPIQDEGVTKHVTVFFDIKDNLKKVAPESDMLKLPFLGRYVEDYTATLDLDQSNGKNAMKSTGSKANLWFAPLFPVTCTMSESLTLALEVITAIKKNDVGAVSLRSYQLVSMDTILKKKDVFAMLEQRNRVYQRIRSENI